MEYSKSKSWINRHFGLYLTGQFECFILSFGHKSPPGLILASFDQKRNSNKLGLNI